MLCQLHHNVKPNVTHWLLSPTHRCALAIPRHPTFRFLTGTAGSEKKLWRKVISIPASFTRSSRSSKVFSEDGTEQGAQQVKTRDLAWDRTPTQEWQCKPHSANILCPVWEWLEDGPTLSGGASKQGGARELSCTSMSDKPPTQPSHH